MIGTNESLNQINRNSIHMSLWAAFPALNSIDFNQDTEASPKRTNFIHQSDNITKKHSNNYLAKSENTDLKKNQSFSLN